MVLSPEPSEEDQQEISTRPREKRDHTRKELDKFKALRCVRLPLEEAQLIGRRRAEDEPLANLRNWSALVQVNNDQRSPGLVRMYTWANEYLLELQTVETKEQPSKEDNVGWMEDHGKQQVVLMHYLAKFLAYSDRTSRMEAPLLSELTGNDWDKIKNELTLSPEEAKQQGSHAITIYMTLIAAGMLSPREEDSINHLLRRTMVPISKTYWRSSEFERKPGNGKVRPQLYARRLIEALVLYESPMKLIPLTRSD